MDNESLILYFHLTRAPSFKATCIITTMRATAYSTRFLIQSSNMCTFVGACKLAPYVHALPFLPLASAYLVVDVRPPYGYPERRGTNAHPGRPQVTRSSAPGGPCSCLHYPGGWSRWTEGPGGCTEGGPCWTANGAGGLHTACSSATVALGAMTESHPLP